MPHTNRKLESGARLAQVGMAVNATLCAAKIGVGLFGHSFALLADGFESLLDSITSLIIWVGLMYAARPADDDHPYGHGKAEALAAILGSMLILGAGGGLAVASVRALGRQRAEPPSVWTLVVLIVVIIVKELLSRTVAKTARETSSMAVEADALHHRTDALTSGAALIGISIAVLGGRRFESADSWAALVACCVIGFNGVKIFWPAVVDLMDTAPATDLPDRIRAAARTVEGVTSTEQCRTRKMGIEYYVDLHVRVNGGMTVSAGHEVAHRVKDAVRTAVPEVADVLVHIEPQK